MKILLFTLILFSTTLGYAQSGDSKNMIVPEGKAVIYLLRPQKLGFAIKMEVMLNGEYWGTTKGKQYLYKVVDPGLYKIEWKVSSNAPTPMTVDAKAGAKYYVLQEIDMGTWHAACDFEMMTEEKGVKALKKCKLAEK